MRPSLHILSERRRHRAAVAPARRTSGPTRGRGERVAVDHDPVEMIQLPTLQTRVPLRRRAAAARLDLDAQRVRESGGPVDNALYACSCGYMFDAAVSTTVACPNCGDQQAW